MRAGFSHHSPLTGSYDIQNGVRAKGLGLHLKHFIELIKNLKRFFYVLLSPTPQMGTSDILP
jgi:hypothetical protein